MNRILMIIGLICCSAGSFAQSSYQFGMLPSLNVNNTFSGLWSFNAKVESRQSFSSGEFNGAGMEGYEYILTDLSIMLSRKTGFNHSTNAGYLVRFREGKIFQRTIQQFIFTRKYTGFTVSHRIATDQTFAANVPAAYRLRYRIAASLPANGYSIDPGEFYYKLNNEYLSEWQGETFDLEVRIVPYLGYEISERDKVEIGMDYRLSSFVSGPGSHRFWISFNWYISL